MCLDIQFVIQLLRTAEIQIVESDFFYVKQICSQQMSSIFMCENAADYTFLVYILACLR